MKKKYQKGFTLVEIIVVVSLLVTLIAIVLPQFSKMKENQILKDTLGDITSILHDAQSQSLASKNSSVYGVHLESNKIISVKGDTFSSGSSDNKITNIVSPASISNVTLSGVSSSSGDLYFERLSGVPSKSGTVTVSTSSMSKIITISATGVVSVE